MQEPDAPYPQESPSAILQATTTVAGLAFALVVLIESDTEHGDSQLTAIIVAFAGLASLISAGYAMHEMWRRTGLGWRDFFDFGRRAGVYPGGVLSFMWWAIALLGVGYVIIARTAMST